MDVFNLLNSYSLNGEYEETNETTEFDIACESIQEIVNTEKSMASYQQFRNADIPQVALESVQEVLVTFICRELGMESGSGLTLNQVCAGFGCSPASLGLGLEDETVDETGKPSRGRILLDKIKNGGKAAKIAMGSGWSRVVENVKSLLGLTMVASTAFEKIDKATTDALARLNSIQNLQLLADVQVEGVNVEEFSSSVSHYKSLISTLEKINKAKDGESSAVINAIYTSLPGLLGIQGSSDSELLSAAKTLRTTAKEKAVNLKNKTIYTGPEGLKAVKSALTSLNKTAQSMKDTADYRELVGSLKKMKKGLSSQDTQKLKIVTQVLNYYIKASSDVLRSLTKGADSLLKVSKRFEKLTGSSKDKDVVASTESFQADTLMESLRSMSAGMESFGYDLGIANYLSTGTEAEEYEVMEAGLENIMMALDAFDYTESQIENFISEKRELAIQPQIKLLEKYGLDNGIESEELSFAMMNGISLMAGTEAEAIASIGYNKKESLYSKAADKLKSYIEWIKKLFTDAYGWLRSKTRVFGSMEVSLKRLISWVKTQTKAAKSKLMEILNKIPGFTALYNKISDILVGMKLKYYCMIAFFKNPKKYMENAQQREELLKILTNESGHIALGDAPLMNDVLSENLSERYDKLVDNIEDFPDNFKSLLKIAKNNAVGKSQRNAEDLIKAYGGADKVPELTKIGSAIENAKSWCSQKWNSLMTAIAELIQKIKDYFKKEGK